MKKSLAEIAASFENSSVQKMLRAMDELPSLKALEALHNSPAFQAAEAFHNSPAFQAAEAFHNSPAFQAAEAFHNSPAFQAAEAFHNSPAFQAAEAFHNSPAFQAAEAFHNSPAFLAMEAYRNSPAFLAMELACQSVIAKPDLLSVQAKLAETQRGLLGDPSWLRVQAEMAGVREKMMALTTGGRIGSGALDSFNQLLAVSAMGGNLIEPANASLSAVARANQWALSLAPVPLAKLQGLYPGLSAVTGLDEIHRTACAISTASGGITMSASLGFTTSLDVELERTCLKLSAFAGASDIHGLDGSTTAAAYQNVFGEWRTRSDLPQRFWRDPKLRHRMYEGAGVDSGLVEAEIGTALEVVVESGLTSGFHAVSGAAAIVSVGTFSMSIRSQDTRVDTYQVLGVFEEQLRAFVSRKLEEKAGPKWFKQRVEGTIGGKAKRAKEAAVRRDEAPMPLIHYTDLGDISTIVLARNNWHEVFVPVFINREEFDHDMQKLVAARRPTAHYRKLDGVRLVELICVIVRLTKRMDNDGAWKDAIESDE